MEIKSKPPADTAAIKIKIDEFLISYFNYLLLALSLIILAAGLFALAFPKYQQISKLNEAAINNLQIEYEAKLNYLASIRNLKKSYQLVSEDDKAKIAVMAPASSDTSHIITEIEAIALRNSAILTSIKIEPASAGGQANPTAEARVNKDSPAGIFNRLPQGAGLIKIEVNLSSVDYSVLKNIIKAFENNLRLFDIAKISFNVGENKALLNIYSYYLPSEAIDNNQRGGLDLNIFFSDKFKNLLANMLIIKEPPEVGKRNPFKPN